MKQLKNGRSKTVHCNGDQLRKLIFSKGFELKQLATLLDYNAGYFAKVIHRNEIGITCVRLLEEKCGILAGQYGISPEDYTTPKDATVTVKQKIQRKKAERAADKPVKDLISVNVQIDEDQLKRLVREAVIEAFNTL